ncbi:uncharacterized protein FIBRA_02977 [Fibroporia radiculosa]|uniref:Tubulin-tyrosine ligase n=1 Tax=Fibroporia radiculosa TaxID=599839 RepID=J4GN81_9APHY|nr:uncharacterized protein FIBRA_02977 [Fibroporia radiculosa]CCM00930.1 predicted protein [Fibroporia radiculosa]
MDRLTAFVSWPSAPLTRSLVLAALAALDPPPFPVPALTADLKASPHSLLQWSTYDAIDHDLTHSAPSGSRVLSSSYIIRKALIRKHYLSRCIHNYLTKHPESILKRAVPKTWDIDISFADELDELWSDDLYDLAQELDQGDPNKWWILKPGMADRGMGIRLFHSKEDLATILEGFEADDSDQDVDVEDQNADTSIITSQLRHFVIQEYISTPLLLDPREIPIGGELKLSLEDLRGHKFHLRVYCVASGALRVYMYTRILSLFSAMSYSPPVVSTDKSSQASINKNLARHLTNTSLQTERGETGVRLLEELVECHVLPPSPHVGAVRPGEAHPRAHQQRAPRVVGQVMDIEQLRASQHEQLRKAQDPRQADLPKVLTAEDVADIKSQIADVLAETFYAALDMSVHFQPLPNAFELYGVDFLVSSSQSTPSRKYQVHLLEVNSEPAIELTGPRLTWILEDLFKAIGKVCVAPFFGASEESNWSVGETREGLWKCLDLKYSPPHLVYMASNTSSVVFDDIFTINAIDKEGKKFDRVSRLYAHSKNYDMDLTLDYNIELYPLQKDQSFALALATSLARGPPGTTDEDDKDRDVWRPDGKGRRGLEEDYDPSVLDVALRRIDYFVVLVKVYRFDGGTAEIVTAYASFGGLLMSLTGSFRHMTSIVLGDPIYILLRK